MSQEQEYKFTGKSAKELVAIVQTNQDHALRQQALAYAKDKIQKLVVKGVSEWRAQGWAKAISQIEAIMAGRPIVALSPVVGATYTSAPARTAKKPAAKKAAPAAPRADDKLDAILALLTSVNSRLDNLDSRVSKIEGTPAASDVDFDEAFAA